MNHQTLFIDNMVCYRCILAVRKMLSENGWQISAIELGRVEVTPLTEQADLIVVTERLREIGLRLRPHGYDMIARAKGAVIEYVYDDSADNELPLSEILTRKLSLSYSHLSRCFSKSEQRTIEEFYQSHRLERAKRLLFQTDLSIKEVAHKVKYKSAGHFSSSFRKWSGKTPKEFKSGGKYRPRQLDKL